MGKRRVAIAMVFVPTLALATGLATQASADTTVSTSSKVVASNWYYNSGVKLPIDVPLPIAIPENPVPPGILIPNGDLAVSSKSADAGNVPDRETYLMFSLGGAHDPATVKSFTFTVTTDSSNLTNNPPTAIPLIACLPSRIWDAGKGATGFSQKPGDDCDNAPAAKYDAKTKSYTFEIKDIAQEWVNGSPVGVAIRHAQSYKPPFILALKPASTIKAKIVYTQLAEAVAGVVSTPNVPVIVPDVAPIVAAPPVAAPDLGVAIPISPTTIAAPQIAVPFTPAGAVRAIGHNRLDGRFWGSLSAGLIGLILIGYFLGRRPAPLAAKQQSSKLSQVLAARARNAAPRGADQ